MTATTVSRATVAPGATASEASVPSAGAVRVATARAVTDAGASTISVTLARRTSPTAMPSSVGEHDAGDEHRQGGDDEGDQCEGGTAHRRSVSTARSAHRRRG